MVPNDKEPGFSFQYLVDLQFSHQQLLASDSYLHIPSEYVDRDCLARHYRRVAYKAGELDGSKAKASV